MSCTMSIKEGEGFSMSEEYKKCSKENGFCKTLNDRVESSGNNSKGLKILTVCHE